jgi:hypothetical protein
MPHRRAQAPKTFGYSETPLIKKLGIKEGARLRFASAPKNFRSLLGPLPRTKAVADGDTLDFAILFVKSQAELAKQFPGLRDRLESNGMLWVSWPKRASGVPTDLSEGIVRDYGLGAGLVDVKVCAIDDTWSGLKFVRRLKDR